MPNKGVNSPHIVACWKHGRAAEAQNNKAAKPGIAQQRIWYMAQTRLDFDSCQTDRLDYTCERVPVNKKKEHNEKRI